MQLKMLYNENSNFKEDEPIEPIILLYFAVISVVAVLLTLYDKLAAKKLPRKRISEAALMWTGALGGAFAMYVVMQLIRHKTQHKKFMVGLPLLMLLHVLLTVGVVCASYRGVILL